MAEFDVTVVGSGVSGLVAGALLARSGLGVCVVEEQPRPGGYLQGFSRRGFTFDTAVQWLIGMGPEALTGRLLSWLGDGAPSCPPLRRIRRYKGDSFDYLLTDEPDQLRDRLAGEFPAQSGGIRRLFDDSRRLGDFMRELYRLSRTPDTMSAWAKTGFGLGMLRRYLPLRRNLRALLEPGLARYVQGTEVGRLFAGEEKLVSAMAPIAWAYQRDYYAPPTGGCQSIVAWLVARLERAGGKLLLREAVDQVLLENGRTAGVRCASGRTVTSRFVLAACDVQRLYERMLPAGAVPAKLLRKLDRADLYYSNFTLFLGLSCDPRTLGLGEEVVNLTRDEMSREAHNSGRPHETSLTVIAPSTRDSTMAPEGKGTLTIHCPAWLSQREVWKTGPRHERGEEYQRAKEDFARILLERVDRCLAPGLARHVEHTEIATPVTYWRYTANREGSIMGGKPTDRNVQARIAHYRTPVKGLFLGGHWSEYGGGVPLAVKSAANTSLLILKEAAPKAFAELRDVMDDVRARASA
ncbi:MAG TPA: NAD(P)/FAD-dependent oxidoreductase [Myxococcales bacterium]